MDKVIQRSEEEYRTSDIDVKDEMSMDLLFCVIQNQ
jgi:hypothetical protein